MESLVRLFIGIEQHHLYSTPTHRHAERQLESSRAAASSNAANSSAGPNSSAKRKLVHENNDHSPGYDFDYDHDDTPKGPLLAVEQGASTNSLQVPASQYGNDAPKSSPKRMRSNEWLLKSREANVSPSQTHGGGKRDLKIPRLRSRRRESHGKTQHGRRSGSTSAVAATEGQRRSRFLEGSMNDRVSEQPPSIYTGEDIDGAIDRYLTCGDEESAGVSGSTARRHPAGYGHAYTSSTTNSMSSVATDTPSVKQSGFVRFGQVIASALNPFGVWNNVSEIWNGSQDGTKASATTMSTGATAHMDILAERQVQAEKAYAELKASGYQGTVKSTSTSSREHPSVEVSGVKKPKNPFFSPGQTPQQQHKPVRSISSNFSKDSLLTPSKSAIRASFQDLRKAASYINLPLSTKRGDSVDKDSNNYDDDEEGTPNFIRKQASRKHLQKQRKLQKKVSNLESQLERLKKQLSEVSRDASDIGNESASASASVNGSVSVCMNGTEQDEEMDLAPPIPPPHREGVKVGRRKKFVPGALPSLPSERILLGQMAEKPTKRSLFTGASPLGPRPLDSKETNTSPRKLRKGSHAMNLAPTTSSRGTSKSIFPSTPHREEYQHNNAVIAYQEKQTVPLASSSFSNRNQVIRKPKLQKPAPLSSSFPPSSDTENIHAYTSSFPPHDDNDDSDQAPSHPNPSPSPKPRCLHRRRSSTTFPSHSHKRRHDRDHDHDHDPDPDHAAHSNTNKDSTNSLKHKAQHSGSGSGSGTMRKTDDIPPVPPLPVNFVAGVNGQRRMEMKAEQMMNMQPREFDWPEDFL
ncbi:hypothetical protein AJ78_08153 [Emergomyces pasteurianus Ep9510]|uniref:Nuclear RNA binding protein n=1 Tax=Emergomyces pasteurianus Ep9510 TaxID=1447872 RepID=A0A1J9P3M1_9EURO|nr:hypothetical protein AJ78_08153 [Emergomyces pasteurianus Ep9510]